MSGEPKLCGECGQRMAWDGRGGWHCSDPTCPRFGVRASPPPAVTGEEEHARRAAIALLLDYGYVLMTQAKYDAHMAEVLRLRSSPVAADVALREAAEYVIYCYDGGLLAPQESNAISRLRAALSRVPSSVAASGGEP